MARLVTVYNYQETGGVEIKWVVTARVYPGEKATRIDPEVPPSVEYVEAVATTPAEPYRIPDPVRFSPKAFEAIMPLANHRFRLQDLDEAVLWAGRLEAQEEIEGAADALFDQRRDDEMTDGQRQD